MRMCRVLGPARAANVCRCAPPSGISSRRLLHRRRWRREVRREDQGLCKKPCKRPSEHDTSDFARVSLLLRMHERIDCVQGLLPLSRRTLSWLACQRLQSSTEKPSFTASDNCQQSPRQIRHPAEQYTVRHSMQPAPDAVNKQGLLVCFFARWRNWTMQPSVSPTAVPSCHTGSTNRSSCGPVSPAPPSVSWSSEAGTNMRRGNCATSLYCPGSRPPAPCATCSAGLHCASG